MMRRWHETPLTGRLVVAIVGLLALGLAVGTLAMTVLLHHRLVLQIDEQLRSSASLMGGTASQILRGNTDAQVLPSDYYVLVRNRFGDSAELVRASTQQHYGAPELRDYDFSPAALERPEPRTVENVGAGPDWRVITLPLAADGEYFGTMTVALPLQSVAHTVAEFQRGVALVDLAIIAVGALAALVVVRRALRPLRQIEGVAGAIAAGDLTQRVPAAPVTTEVGSLAASLNAMLSRIEHAFEVRRASDARMRRFVADASHELRTPLATVRGYGELYRLGGIPAGEVAGAMGRIESEATRMSRLVEDLLQLARLDEGRRLELDTEDLVVLSVDAAADVRALDPARPVRVVGLTDPTAAPTFAVVDEFRVRQVLTNLVGNAVQHTPPGTPVEIAVGADGANAVLEVRDHGPGVDPEDLGRIFGRFYRVDTSRSRHSGGTGLGLAIVAAIANAHGGTAEGLPTPGGGLTVRIYLPLAGPGTETDTLAPSPA